MQRQYTRTDTGLVFCPTAQTMAAMGYDCGDGNIEDLLPEESSQRLDVHFYTTTATEPLLSYSVIL
jgi:hypothetical protein